MFLEQKGNKIQKKGWIEVVCGSMFSGKTEELIRRLKRAEFAKQKVESFTPSVGLRCDAEKAIFPKANEIGITILQNATNFGSLTDYRYKKSADAAMNLLGERQVYQTVRSTAYYPESQIEKSKKAD